MAEGLAVERLVLIALPLSYRSPSEAAWGATDAAHSAGDVIAGELRFDPRVGDLALETYLARLDPSRARWDLTEGLNSLQVDILLLASIDDERFDIGAARELVKSLRRAALTELSRLDHRSSALDPAAVEAIMIYLELRGREDGPNDLGSASNRGWRIQLGRTR